MTKQTREERLEKKRLYAKTHYNDLKQDEKRYQKKLETNNKSYHTADKQKRNEKARAKYLSSK